MNEKTIKTKPQGTPKVKSAPKTKNAASDMKSAVKDVLVSDIIKSKTDKAKQNGQSDRAEVQAAENVETAAYTAADTAYQKSKSFTENKLKQQRQRVKTRQNQNTDIPHTPQNDFVSEVKSTPKQIHSVPKTKESVQAGQSVSTHKEVKPQPKAAAQVKTKEKFEKKAQESRAEVPETDYQPKKVETFSVDETIPKQQIQAVKSETPAPKVKTENGADIAFSSRTMPKTKESYIRPQGKNRADLIKTPDRAKAVPKQKTHTVTRTISSNAKKAVKTKNSLSNSASRAVKTGNSYVSSAAKKKSVKAAKRAAKTQKEVTKKAAKQAAKQAKQAAQKAVQAAKATTKAAVKIAVKVAQMVVAATKTIVSALAALGGWAVLLVALIIVIVVAVIAASPFGIFISDEAADNDSIPISSIVAECNVELSAKLDTIENAAAADRSEMIGEQANWDLVLAVFATKVAGVEDDTVEDVVVITEEKKQKLKNVFWDMHEITSRTETVTNGKTSEKVIYITINTKTKDDMIAQYHFTRKQQEALATLLEQDEMLISATHSLAISDKTAQDILKNLPDGLSPERKKVIKAACSLVGKVNYFWGGKSSAIGWDSEWGKLKTVSAEGSKTTGTKRPFGLDCSGFVTWSFINSGFSASAIGHGTQGQIAKCSRISWSQAQAGDLAFFSDLSHVGIVAGKDKSGNILVIHCSSGANNVVITTNSIFGFAAKPGCY